MENPLDDLSSVVAVLLLVLSYAQAMGGLGVAPYIKAQVYSSGFFTL